MLNRTYVSVLTSYSDHSFNPVRLRLQQLLDESKVAGLEKVMEKYRRYKEHYVKNIRFNHIERNLGMVLSS